MKRSWKYLCIIIIMCTLIFSISACDGTNAAAKPARHERFVEVDAELICPEYHLGIQRFYSDGTPRDDESHMIYLVDQVSRYVYIYMWDTGAYSSGIAMIECLDADGNHMRYEGELPN